MRDAGVGHPPGRIAHHPLDEHRIQSGPVVGRGGRGPSEDSFPSSDRWLVAAPCNRAKSVNVSPSVVVGLMLERFAVRFAALLPSFNVGVGNRSAIIDSGVKQLSLPSCAASLARYCSTVPPGSCAAGVGSNDEDPVTSVRSSDIGSSNAAPPEVIPARGHVGCAHVEPWSSSNESCDVLHEDVAGSQLANETGVL